MNNTNKPHTIAKVVKKYRIGEQPTDATYWRTLPPQARLAALEQIRRHYITWKYGTEPRFQRVYTIIKR